MAAVALPLLHEYAVPPVAVRVVLEPMHTIPSLLIRPEVSATSITGVSTGFTVRFKVAIESQPAAVLKVALWLPPVVKVNPFQT